MEPLGRSSLEAYAGLALAAAVGALAATGVVVNPLLAIGLWAIVLFALVDFCFRSQWTINWPLRRKWTATALVAFGVVALAISARRIAPKEAPAASASDIAKEVVKRLPAAPPTSAALPPPEPFSTSRNDGSTPTKASDAMRSRSSGSVRSRIRIINVVGVEQDGGPFPAITAYYNNAGSIAAKGIGVRFAAAFVPGQLPPEVIAQTQNDLLSWDGWRDLIASRIQYEMYPGDSGEFTSVPNMEGELANDFRTKWEDVKSGKTLLYIFLTFKYVDNSMPPDNVGVTEDCFWFSGNFARHNCGRGRAFLENRQYSLSPSLKR